MKFPASGAVGVLSLCLLSTSALANSSGMVGNSGKDGATRTCNACHMGGSAPTVTLSGPASLAAGATGEYTLVIKGGAGVKAGMNVSVNSSTASLTAGTDSKKLSGELTHQSPKTMTGGEARYTFSLVAPSAGGSLKLFASGNSVNGDGNTTGDMSASTSLDVTVTGGSTNPTTPDVVEDEAKAGCSAAGGAPGLLVALGAMLALRRRRS